MATKTQKKRGRRLPSRLFVIVFSEEDGTVVLLEFMNLAFDILFQVAVCGAAFVVGDVAEFLEKLAVDAQGELLHVRIFHL